MVDVRSEDVWRAAGAWDSAHGLMAMATTFIAGSPALVLRCGLPAASDWAARGRRTAPYSVVRIGNLFGD